MTTVRVSWIPATGEPVDLGEAVSDLEFVTGPATPIELLSRAQRFLVVSASLLERTGPYTVRLRGRLYWSGYRQIFGRTCPRSSRVKTEYHRRLRSRGRRR
jgi:hypothetical protein